MVFIRKVKKVQVIMNSKEVVKKLIKNGFYKKSQKGTSHYEFKRGS